MSDLSEFAERIKVRIANAGREPHWTSDEAASYMLAISERRRRFQDLAVLLTDAAIRPRLDALSECFENASKTKDDPFGQSSCWFGYCERFPTTAGVSFVVEHDVRLENAMVRYEASMAPQFIRFNEHDKLTAPLEEIGRQQVESWVEERLLEFLDAYLRIDRGQNDFDDEVATDPVCGMRIRRSEATNDQYCGHRYFFCSADCRDNFSREPTAYVKIHTL